jgi:hypothetical protein
VVGRRIYVFKIQCESFLDVENCFLDALPKTGHINVEALGDVKVILPVDAIFYSLIHAYTDTAFSFLCNSQFS